MQAIVKTLKSLMKSEVKDVVDSRVREFEKMHFASSRVLFKELCFCLLTANFNAERAIEIQSKIDDGFITLTEKQLAGQLKKMGYRYPNARAKYIIEARNHLPSLKTTVHSFKNSRELREWVVGNVKGLGYKEASHFLRNIGFMDVAIIDFHIVDILVHYGLIEKPKILSKKIYLEVEEILGVIGRKVGLTQGELDLYLWYCETGKILK